MEIISTLRLHCSIVAFYKQNKATKKVFTSVAIVESKPLHLSLKDFPEINRGEWLPAEI